MDFHWVLERRLSTVYGVYHKIGYCLFKLYFSYFPVDWIDTSFFTAIAPFSLSIIDCRSFFSIFSFSNSLTRLW